jgi:hypothetical protein
MHGHINVKYPNNISKWQMEFNSAFKGLMVGGLGVEDQTNIFLEVLIFLCVICNTVKV